MQSYLRQMADILKYRFLLASLHIEAILRETSIARRGKMLKAVKDGAGLGGAYGSTLERIRTQGGEKTKLAMATLMWICHAERPLQVDELRHALAVEIGSTEFDSENAPSIAALIGCCQGLITVDKEASTVRLIHFTVQEYLCAHPDLFSRPHMVIAEACLTYLNSQHIKNLPSHPLLDHQIMPFLNYSSRYWGTHAKREISDQARVLALDLLNQYEDHLSALSLSKQILDPSYVGGADASPGFSGLHCVSFFGIHELATTLINTKSCEINQGDCGGNTPLQWAAKNGHDGVVKLLLGLEDVDPDRPDNRDSTPLSWAAYKGYKRVVRLLLGRKDVDPDRPNKGGSTPLLWAANNGHKGVVKLLLGQKDIDPNRPNGDDRTPLGCAAAGGREGVVKLLLSRKDVDPNRPSNDDRTPLGWAAVEGHEGVAELLLDRKDVDPNCPCKDGLTPLGWAAFKGHEGIVKLLLGRKDIDPDRPDKGGSTPLLWAANNGHKGVVKLLLGQKDIDPNRPNGGDRTPLGCAAAGGREGVVKLLLSRKDVDPNRPSNDDRTPLGWAAVEGHEGVIKLLLGSEDISPNRPDKFGRTPLAWAKIKGHETIAILLQARIPIESIGAQPLH